MRKPSLNSLLITFFFGLVLSGFAWANTDYPVHSNKWTKKYDRHFKKYSKRYFGPLFDWHWFKSQAIAESGLNEKAESRVGARGLMQIMPTTFEEISDKIPHYMELDEPRWNIAAGIYYDRSLYRKFKEATEQERLYLALASYNAGYGRILKARRRVENKHSWDEVKKHVPGQTRAYVYRIRKLMGEE
jgi:membrane-bound lytic murein transglycosylase F